MIFVGQQSSKDSSHFDPIAASYARHLSLSRYRLEAELYFAEMDRVESEGNKS